MTGGPEENTKNEYFGYSNFETKKMSAFGHSFSVSAFRNSGDSFGVPAISAQNECPRGILSALGTQKRGFDFPQ